ncbi:MAG: right-handed parallel beta-helix repeat-containing protein [Flavobacteriales bacterium]|jgi:polygalacturonase|nr:right-handed parallel beta-helix repeat-containing protein [Flavobacteriales bacterium]
MRNKPVIGIVICLLAFSTLGWSQQMRLNVLNFGANNLAQTLSTISIQNTIDSCYRMGGGIVHLPAGDYMSGTLVLKDNVTLLLDSGAILHASPNLQDYRAPLQDAVRPTLIYANGAKNIGISGKGTIQGDAKRTYEPLRKVDRQIAKITESAKAAGVEMKRFYATSPDVALVVITNCSNVRVEGVSLVESSFWSLLLFHTQDIEIRDIHIRTSLEKGVNSDGLDINSCSNVNVSDCVIRTGDDAIALKSWDKVPCENVKISNCELSSSSTALKIGTETQGDIKHVQFTNCKILDANRGMSIVVRDGANVEDVRFSNIEVTCTRRHFNWWGNADPIWISLSRRAAHIPLGSIKDVTFENIRASGMGTSKIETSEESGIENIRLINVQLDMHAENYLDKRSTDALVIQNVKDVELTNLRVDWAIDETEPKWGSALVLKKVDGFLIRNFTGRQGLIDSDIAAIQLENAKRGSIQNATASPGARTFISLSGLESSDIKMSRIDKAGNSTQPFIMDDSVLNRDQIECCE